MTSTVIDISSDEEDATKSAVPVALNSSTSKPRFNPEEALGNLEKYRRSHIPSSTFVMSPSTITPSTKFRPILPAPSPIPEMTDEAVLPVISSVYSLKTANVPRYSTGDSIVASINACIDKYRVDDVIDLDSPPMNEPENDIKTDETAPAASTESEKVTDDPSSSSAPSEIQHPTNNKDLFMKFVKLCGELEEDPGDRKRGHDKLCDYFSRATSDYVQSESFTHTLLKVTHQLHKQSLYICMKEVMDELQIRRDKKRAVLQAAPGPSNSAPAGDKAVPSTSGASDNQLDTNNYSGEHDDAIKKLSSTLEILNKKIKDLENAEVDWDDDANSSYLKMDRYRIRFAKVYKKLSQLTGMPQFPGRCTKKKVKFTGSQYPEINKAVERWLNRTGEFPDFNDLINLLETLNLSLPPFKLHAIASDVFREIGKILQKRRQLELMETLGFSTVADDPATADPKLDATLHKNHEEFKKKTQDIINMYVQKQMEGGGKDDDESGDDDDEEDNPKSPTNSEDASDTENINLNSEQAASDLKLVPTSNGDTKENNLKKSAIIRSRTKSKEETPPPKRPRLRAESMPTKPFGTVGSIIELNRVEIHVPNPLDLVKNQFAILRDVKNTISQKVVNSNKKMGQRKSSTLSQELKQTIAESMKPKTGIEQFSPSPSNNKISLGSCTYRMKTHGTNTNGSSTSNEHQDKKEETESNSESSQSGTNGKSSEDSGDGDGEKDGNEKRKDGHSTINDGDEDENDEEEECINDSEGEGANNKVVADECQEDPTVEKDSKESCTEKNNDIDCRKSPKGNLENGDNDCKNTSEVEESDKKSSLNSQNIENNVEESEKIVENKKDIEKGELDVPEKNLETNNDQDCLDKDEENEATSESSSVEKENQSAADSSQNIPKTKEEEEKTDDTTTSLKNESLASENKLNDDDMAKNESLNYLKNVSVSDSTSPAQTITPSENGNSELRRSRRHRDVSSKKPAWIDSDDSDDETIAIVGESLPSAPEVIKTPIKRSSAGGLNESDAKKSKFTSAIPSKQDDDLEVISESIVCKPDVSPQERVQRFLQSAKRNLSITVTRKPALSRETKLAIDQLKKLKNISVGKTKVDEPKPGPSRIPASPRPIQRSPAKRNGMPIITHVQGAATGHRLGLPLVNSGRGGGRQHMSMQPNHPRLFSPSFTRTRLNRPNPAPLQNRGRGRGTPKKKVPVQFVVLE